MFNSKFFTSLAASLESPDLARALICLTSAIFNQSNIYTDDVALYLQLLALATLHEQTTLAHNQVKRALTDARVQEGTTATILGSLKWQPDIAVIDEAINLLDIGIELGQSLIEDALEFLRSQGANHRIRQIYNEVYGPKDSGTEVIQKMQRELDQLGLGPKQSNLLITYASVVFNESEPYTEDLRLLRHIELMVRLYVSRTQTAANQLVKDAVENGLMSQKSADAIGPVDHQQGKFRYWWPTDLAHRQVAERLAVNLDSYFYGILSKAINYMTRNAVIGSLVKAYDTWPILSGVTDGLPLVPPDLD